MNIFCKLQITKKFYVVFLMLNFVVCLHGAAAQLQVCDQASLNLDMARQTMMENFYVGKLNNFHPKFVQAACRAIVQSKGQDFLWGKYQEDLKVAMSSKKNPKESESLRCIRVQCQKFELTYEKHKFWERYSSAFVKEVLAAVLENESVTPAMLLENVVSDDKGLAHGYEKLIRKAEGISVSPMVQAMFTHCENNKHSLFFNKMFRIGSAQKEFDDSWIEKFIQQRPRFAQMKERLGDKFVSDWFCIAIRITEGQTGVLAKKWTTQDQFLKVMEAYDALSMAVGKEWQKSEDNRACLRSLLRRLSHNSSYWQEVSFDTRKFEGMMGSGSLRTFCLDKFQSLQAQNKLIADNQRWFVESQNVASECELESASRKEKLLKDSAPKVVNLLKEVSDLEQSNSNLLRHAIGSRYFRALTEYVVKKKNQRQNVAKLQQKNNSLESCQDLGSRYFNKLQHIVQVKKDAMAAMLECEVGREQTNSDYLLAMKKLDEAQSQELMQAMFATIMRQNKELAQKGVQEQQTALHVTDLQGENTALTKEVQQAATARDSLSQERVLLVEQSEQLRCEHAAYKEQTAVQIADLRENNRLIIDQAKQAAIDIASVRQERALLVEQVDQLRDACTVHQEQTAAQIADLHKVKIELIQQNQELRRTNAARSIMATLLRFRNRQNPFEQFRVQCYGCWGMQYLERCRLCPGGVAVVDYVPYQDFYDPNSPLSQFVATNDGSSDTELALGGSHAMMTPPEQDQDTVAPLGYRHDPYGNGQMVPVYPR